MELNKHGLNLVSTRAWSIYIIVHHSFTSGSSVLYFLNDSTSTTFTNACPVCLSLKVTWKDLRFRSIGGVPLNSLSKFLDPCCISAPKRSFRDLRFRFLNMLTGNEDALLRPSF